jgi:hypothetical protein
VAELSLEPGTTVEVEQPEIPSIVLPPPVSTGTAVSVAVPEVPLIEASPPLPSDTAVAVVPVPGPAGQGAELTPEALEEVVVRTTVATGTALTEHIGDPTPHPAYDDLPSLRLLFENGLV